MKVAAGCILYLDNKILLGKRAKEPFKGMWSIVGGKVEEDETIEDCVRREIKEELGLEIENLKFLASVPDGVNQGNLFIGKIKGSLNVNKNEILETKFFTMKEVKKIDMAFNHKELLLENWKK